MGMKNEADEASHIGNVSRRSVLAGLAGAVLVPGFANAQAKWPSRSVRFITYWAPGGAVDTLSRIYCQKMSEISGQQFFVDNRVGGGGMVGAGVLARSDPDGYTLGICSITTNSIPGLMYSKLPFDPASDFKLISGLWRLPNLLVVSKSLPVNSVPELIAYLKKNPGKYFFASSGQGTTTHLCGEMFKQQANVDIEHVPFRGGSQAVTAMLAGDVQIYFDNISGALPLVRDGRLKGLAVTSSERDVNAPEFPTMSETLPGFDVTSWCGVAGPAKIPSDVVTTLTKYTAEALKDEQLIRKFAEFGATVWPTTSEFITKYRNEEEARYRPVIEKVGIKLD